MAFYRFEAAIVGREGRGRSVVAAAAYRAASKLRDDRCEKTFDYTPRRWEVTDSTILAPEGAPDWVFDSERLWNRADSAEVRKDAQTARDFVLGLPVALPPAVQFETAKAWAEKELISRGMIAEVSHHIPREGLNTHVHVFCTLRPLDGDKFSAKKDRTWNEVAFLKHLRESFADAVNAALEKQGSEERVSHKSLKDRGLDRVPEPKKGVEATAMKRRDPDCDPIKFQQVRDIKFTNSVRPVMKAIQKLNQVTVKSLWQQSRSAACHAGNWLADMAKGMWQRFSHRQSDAATPASDFMKTPKEQSAQKALQTGVKHSSLSRQEAMRQKMDALSNARLVAKASVAKVTAGIAIYVAHIRQQDQNSNLRQSQGARGPERNHDKMGRTL